MTCHLPVPVHQVSLNGMPPGMHLVLYAETYYVISATLNKLTRRVSCVKWRPQKLVKRKRGAHEKLYTTNPGRKISYFSIM